MNQEMPTFDVSSIPAEFSPLNPFDGQTSAKTYAGDDKLFVQFRTDAVMNPSKSTTAGRPIFDDIDMIIIRTPGSQLTSIVAPVKHYMQRFGEKYNKWKATQEQAISGTPLELFPTMFNKPSMVAELKAMNVYTVEQLAGLSDAGKQKLMGGFELCKRAADWLVHSKTETEDAEKEALKHQVADMQKQLDALSTKSVPTGAVPKEK